MEDSSKSREHGMSLLVHRRKVTADAAKSGDPRSTPKGARNLLLHFCPAKVPLGLVVRKRDPQVVEQSQHLIGTRHERVQKILGLALLAPAFPLSRGRGGGGGVGGIATRQNLEIGSDPFGAPHGGAHAQREQTPPLTRGM